MRRLILNADDFGYDPAVTRGIVEAMAHGLVSSTTMVVNAPHSEPAARFTDALAVGLHLNLARFRSLWRPGLELEESQAAGYTADFVEGEAHAQLDRFRALVGRDATHLDVHKHLHRHPAVLEGVARAARSRSLPVRSVDEAMRRALRAAQVRTNDAFLGEAGDEAYWTVARLAEQLERLPEDGVVELMCHPGYAPETLRSGYAQQREVELETFTGAGARALVERLGLRFVSWAEALGEG